jgi:hypothetical protein
MPASRRSSVVLPAYCGRATPSPAEPDAQLAVLDERARSDGDTQVFALDAVVPAGRVVAPNVTRNEARLPFGFLDELEPLAGA